MHCTAQTSGLSKHMRVHTHLVCGALVRSCEDLMECVNRIHVEHGTSTHTFTHTHTHTHTHTQAVCCTFNRDTLM